MSNMTWGPEVRKERWNATTTDSIEINGITEDFGEETNQIYGLFELLEP